MSKIFETKNYDKFVRAIDNRSVSKHPELVKSMTAFGFLSNYPIMVEEDEDGKLKILDGQHRFSVAKELGLPLKYAFNSVKGINIPLLNNATKRWSPKDFVSSFVSQGNQEYIKLQGFCETYGVSISIGASLLCGLALSGSAPGDVGLKTGKFKVRDLNFASRVMEVVVEAGKYLKFSKTSIFIDCVARSLAVPGFDAKRFVHVIQKNPLAFKPQATIDQTLQMFEDAYNLQSREPIPLKFLAQNLVKARKENGSRNVKLSVEEVVRSAKKKLSA